jgi:predicted CoA-binding protein
LCATSDLFAPRSVAVLGASSDPAKWGQWIAQGALRGTHRRDVWLVNRGGGQILGQPAFTSLAELLGMPELVVVALPVAAFEEEDTDLVVSVQAGLNSGAVPQGRLMRESEQLIADFQRRLFNAIA